MEQTTVQSVLAAVRENVPAEEIANLTRALEAAPEEKAQQILGLSLKSPMVMLIIAWFLGGFGVDRFMLGKTGQGVGKLLTCGGCGIWAIINLFTVMGETKKFNLEKIQELL